MSVSGVSSHSSRGVSQPPGVAEQTARRAVDTAKAATEKSTAPVKPAPEAHAAAKAPPASTSKVDLKV